MTDFTSQEIQAAANRLVLSSIDRSYDLLGTRRSGATLSNIFEVISSTYLNFFGAPFYTIYLASLRVQELVQAEAQVIETILSLIQAADKVVLPIDSISSIANAREALFALESAVSEQISSLKNIEGTPEFARFEANVDNFVGKYGNNIKQNGSIIPTPLEASSILAQMLSGSPSEGMAGYTLSPGSPGYGLSLDALHRALIGRVQLLRDAMVDFNSVNLASIVSARVISNAREIFTELYNQLENLGEQQRLEFLRQTVLNMLSAKALVRAYGVPSRVSVFYDVEGQGQPYADATHPAEAATVDSDNTGPYTIINGYNTLDLYLEREESVITVTGTQITPLPGTSNIILFATANFVSLGVTPGYIMYVDNGLNTGTRWVVYRMDETAPGLGDVLFLAGTIPFQAEPPGQNIRLFKPFDVQHALATSKSIEILGFLVGPFTIIAATNDIIAFSFDGAAPVEVTLTAGTPDASTVAGQINAGLPGTAPIVAEPYFKPLKWKGSVNVVDNGGFVRFEKSTGTSWLDLDIQPGDLYVDVSGFYGTDTIGTVTANTIDTSTVFAGAVEGAVIELGSVNRAIRFVAKDPITAIPHRTRAKVMGNDGSTNGAIWESTAQTLGFFPFVEDQASPTHAGDVVNDINSNVPGMTAEMNFEVLSTWQSRTDPGLPYRIVLYKLRGTVTVDTSTLPTVTLVGDFSSISFNPGDEVVIRISNTLDVVGVPYAVDAITDTELTFTDPGYPGDDGEDVLIEVGENLDHIEYGDVLYIESSPNTGYYILERNGYMPTEPSFEVYIDKYKAVPVAQLGADPVFSTAQLGKRGINFSSNHTESLDSRLVFHVPVSSVVYPGAALFFLSVTPVVNITGTTEWFQLPETPKGLVVGDILELYETQYNEPSQSFNITTIDGLIIQIEPPIDSTLSSFTFSLEIPVPFARLRVGQVYDFDTLYDRLDTWLNLSVNNADRYFSNLTRLANPIIYNQNPTAAQVNDVKNHLESLYEILTAQGAALTGASEEATVEWALGQYTVEPIQSVDLCLNSLRQTGADRALDILLEGRFSDFFALDSTSASYGSYMMELTRQVAREDLPIRKVARDDAASFKVDAVINDIDYEYSQDDIETEFQPDPATDPDDLYI